MASRLKKLIAFTEGHDVVTLDQNIHVLEEYMIFIIWLLYTVGKQGNEGSNN